MKRLLIGLALGGLCALTLPIAPTKVHGQTGIDPNTWYNIIAKHSGLCLDVQSASRSAGAKLIQYYCHYGDNQTFRFEPTGDGYYRIIAGHSGMCIDEQGANYTDGGLFIQYYCHLGLNQQFQAWPGQVGLGLYNQINVRHSGKNMDVKNASYAASAQIIQYFPHGADNQQFELRPAPSVPCAGRDNDGDGFNACTDCNDNDPSVNPAADPDCAGGGDRNCNGIWDSNECNSCDFCYPPTQGRTR
ncbi:MAG TPA: RICIN domain-containing protein [Pyrinomonadaceae bacterium]